MSNKNCAALKKFQDAQTPSSDFNVLFEIFKSCEKMYVTVLWSTVHYLQTTILLTRKYENLQN